jgi:peptide/nickel transport system permease protein
VATAPTAHNGRDAGQSAFARLAGVTRSPMLRLIVKRVLMAIPIMLGVSLLTFIVLTLIPGSGAQQLLGIEATEEQIAALEAQMGLDRPPHVQYLSWLQGVVTGDLGTSMVSGQAVTSLFGSRLPVTFQLVAMAFLISVLLAIPVALVAARWPGGLMDRLSMVVSMTGLAVANYVLALLLVLVFAVMLGVLPAIGYVPLSESITGNLRSMTLPVIAIAFPLFCFYTRFLRGDLVEQMLSQDYVDTARAKGIGPWRVLIRHAFRNSSFGLITLVGLNLGTIIGGTVIIEQIFALPGLGQLLLQSINARDAVVVQACVLIFAVVAVTANLVVDLLYLVLDPRIRYGSR